MKSILTSHLKRIENTPGELEESGKILGKDLWVRAHLRENTVEKDDEQIDEAPEQLKYLNEVTISN